MLIDLYSGNYYTFSFKELFEYLHSLSQMPIYTEYLNKWKSLLSLLEKNVEAEKKNFQRISANFSNYEWYQFECSIPQISSRYLYHFNIESILSNINYKNSKYAFVHRISKIAKHNFISNVDKTKLKKDPIVISPLLTTDCFYTVIDGNARLSYKIEKHSPFVKYCVYYPKNMSDFLFSVDWGVYWLTYEVNCIMNHHDMEKAIKQSIIYSSYCTL